MGQFHESIPENIIEWIKTQHVFWVATAPLSGTGHVNVSPKGISGTFHVINENKVWYEDVTGSGVETISHLRENGRVTIMFSAFSGPPRIVRLWGTGTVHEFGTAEYEKLIPPATRQPGSRSAIVIDVHKVGSSCGFAVPYYEYKGPRHTLTKWSASVDNREFDFELQPDSKADADTFADKGLRYWQREWNLKSMDGLPGIQIAHKTPITSVVTERPSRRVEEVNFEKELKGQTFTAKASNSLFPDLKVIVAFLLGLLVALALPRLEGVLPELIGLDKLLYSH